MKNPGIRLIYGIILLSALLPRVLSAQQEVDILPPLKIANVHPKDDLPLLAVCAKSDYPTASLRAKLEAGADVNAQEPETLNTPLLLLLKAGGGRTAYENCMALLEYDVDVNLANAESVTPLMRAAECNAGVCRLLLEKGAKVDARDAQHRTPLHYAASTAFKWKPGGVDYAYTADDIMAVLLAAGADVNAKTFQGVTPLMTACLTHNHLSHIIPLLDAGADVNAVSGGQTTAFKNALTRGRREMAETLIDRGADVTLCDDRKSPIAFGVVKLQDLDLLEKYLARGGTVNTANAIGRTPLFDAAASGDTLMCKRLLEKGLDVNARDEYENTPLWRAVDGCHEATVRFLLSAGAKFPRDEVDEKTGCDLTHLMLRRAVRSGNPTFARLILEQGAVTDGPLPTQGFSGDEGRLLQMAVRTGEREMCEFVLEIQPDVNYADRSGRTALHTAAQELNYDLCEFLLSRGAKINAEDNAGMTPLVYVARAQRYQGPGSRTGLPGIRVFQLLLNRDDDFSEESKSWKAIREILTRYTENKLFRKYYRLMTGDFPDKDAPTEILWAAYDGDVELLDKLMVKPLSAYRDTDGDSLLHYAVWGNQVKTLEFLLKLNQGAKFNREPAVDAKGLNVMSPLHLAAGLGRVEIVEFLLAAGANIDARALSSATAPMHCAILGSRDACVELLVKHTPNMLEISESQTPFLLALAMKNDDYCRLFLEHFPQEKLRVWNDSAMNRNADRLSLQNLRRMKKFGADFNQVNFKGDTMLHHAISWDIPGVIPFMLENGVDPHLQNKEGVSALDFARRKQNRVAWYLIQDFLEKQPKP